MKPHRDQTAPALPLWPLIALGLVVTAIFLINATVRTNTYLVTDELFTRRHVRLGTPPAWSLFGEGLEDPYRCRMLFRFLMVGLARLLEFDQAQFKVGFGVLNWLLSLGVTAAIYLSGPTVFRLSRVGSSLAALFYVTSFVHLFPFEYPNYVVEDFLCYLLLMLGLIAMGKRRWALFQLCVVAGMLSRETLLVLVGVMWLHERRSLLWHGAMSLPGLLALLIPRAIVGGGVGYDLWLGYFHNMTFWQTALGFGLVTFATLWLVGPLGWILCRDGLQGTPASPRVSIAAVAVIFLTTLLFGRFLETRVMFLAFPWICIPAAMQLSTVDWPHIRWRRFAALCALVTAAYAVALFGVGSADEDWRVGWSRALPFLRDFFRASAGIRLVHFSVWFYLTGLWVCLALSGGLRQRASMG